MSKKTVWRQVTRSCILSLLSISLENMSQEIEIGLGKKGRLAYSLDDVSIVPSRRTRDPQDVSTSWQVDAYEFDVPVIGAPMDSVTSPATAIAMGKMGALGVLDLEGLWTRYDDPQPLLDEIAELPAESATERIQQIYAEPIKPELIVERLHEIRDAGVTVAGALSPQRTQDYYSTVLEAGVDLFVIRGTSKFFAAPGIRLGYGISSNQAFLDRFKTNTNPWSVNSLADFIGQHIFTDFEFHKKTQTLVSEERRKAFAELSTWKNIKAYPSEANFILLKLKTDRITAHELFEKCIQKKMLIRDASSFTFLDESYLRFCILSPEHNAALLAELKKWVEE